MIEAGRLPIILLADDDADDRLLVKDALQDGSYGGLLRCVENGEEVVDYLNGRGKFSNDSDHPQPDLILLDLNMPRMNGKEVLRNIKCDTGLRHIPVVVFTTSQADTDIAAVYELGANSFVSKPAAYDALVELMCSLQEYWFKVVQLPQAIPQTP